MDVIQVLWPVRATLLGKLKYSHDLMWSNYEPQFMNEWEKTIVLLNPFFFQHQQAATKKPCSFRIHNTKITI
jgi:hypothetical protein